MNYWNKTTCDLCNVDGELDSGTIEGTEEDALAAGWEERDFGFICPQCILMEKEQEQRDQESNSMSLGYSGLMAFIRAYALPKKE